MGDICDINPKNENLPNTFIYIDLESVVDGSLQKENTVLKEEAPSRAQRILFKNDILFQMVRPYQKNNLFFDKDGDFVASTGYAQIRTKENSQFIFQYLHNQNFVDKVIERCTGTSYPAINSSDLGKIKIAIPKLEEQKKIGDFLNIISQRILSQKKIIEDTRKMKLNFSHNLFTQNFRISKKYISKWEEKTLGDISTIIMGQSPDSSAYNSYEKGLPLIQGNADIVQRFSKPRQFTSQITKTCDIGDIILTIRAPVGHAAKSKHFACIGRGVCAIKSNEKSDSEFIYQFLLYFENKWSSFEQGSTFTSVNSSDIKTIKINVPTIEEQREIAQFLKTFDEKINIETELLAHYENQKKYLLQNLFV